MVDIRNKISQTIEEQNGVILGESSLVGRDIYTGRNVIAPNNSLRAADDRGYLQVELWIMSKTSAANPIQREKEGITKLIMQDGLKIYLDEAERAASNLLFGDYSSNWPLTKILDIGGEEIKPHFDLRWAAKYVRDNKSEVPPIPVHVHGGEVVKGKISGLGKLEAYFFPPLDIRPYNLKLRDIKTRIGLKPKVSKEEFFEAFEHIGISDDMYALLREYKINAYDGWTIRPKVLHAPGPWVTFEIQRPLDDFNFAAWKLGQRYSERSRKEIYKEYVLRGLKNSKDFLKQVIDWSLCSDPIFKRKYFRRSKEIRRGRWGRKLQIFYDEFLGFAYEIEPFQSIQIKKEQRPYAGFVWSGTGRINNLKIADTNCSREFLVTPHHVINIENSSKNKLMIYMIYPIQKID